MTPQPSFAALRHPGYRAYFFGAAIAMMADSIEHVISYWILFQKFESQALAGFAVVSHWLPFLLFSLYSGALADRFDPRRLIQLGMALFMLASLGWALLFLFDVLEMWHAVALLTLHGFAGVLWTPAAQLFIHQLVGERELHSAIRLTVTARWLGLLAGPAVGGAILLLMGRRTACCSTSSSTAAGRLAVEGAVQARSAQACRRCAASPKPSPWHAPSPATAPSCR
jgi:MFS family permease